MKPFTTTSDSIRAFVQTSNGGLHLHLSGMANVSYCLHYKQHQMRQSSPMHLDHGAVVCGGTNGSSSHGSGENRGLGPPCKSNVSLSGKLRLFQFVSGSLTLICHRGVQIAGSSRLQCGFLPWSQLPHRGSNYCSKGRHSRHHTNWRL